MFPITIIKFHHTKVSAAAFLHVNTAGVLNVTNLSYTKDEGSKIEILNSYSFKCF